MKNNYLNVLLISGSGIIAGILNYVYHPIMLQFLSFEEFGVFGSLVGVFNILGVLFLGIDLFLTKSYSSRIQDISRVKYLFLYSLNFLFFIGIGSFLIFLLCSPLLSSYLKISDLHLIILSGMMLTYGVVGVSIGAILKSMRAFHIISLQQIFGPVIKLVLGFALVYFGFKVTGALFAFIIAGVFPLVYGLWYILNKLRRVEAVGNTRIIKKEFLQQKNEILQFFIMSLVFALYMNLDVIIAKNLFLGELSGIYAAIGVLGKFLIFLLLSIETVYFGQIMEYQRSTLPKNLLKNPLILITIIVVGAILMNLILGNQVLSLLKPGLEEHRNIYLFTLVYYGALAYTSFAMKILTGWKKYYINWILGAILLITILTLYTYGVTNLSEYVYILVFGGFVAMIVSIGILYYEYMNREKS